MGNPAQILTEAWGYLLQQFGPMAPYYLVGFLGVVLVVIAAPYMLRRPSDPLDKLARNDPARAARKKKEAAAAADQPKLRYDNTGPNLDRFASFLEPQDQKEYSAARLKLVQAGYRQKSSVRTYHFMQMALAIGFLFVGIIVVLIRMDSATLQSTLLTILIPAAAGYYLPSYWVERRRQTRQSNLGDGFPDALDLMLVCVEAGQSLDQSILRVGTEIRPGYPDLSDEFIVVANEMKAGKDRVSVLRDFGERAGVPDISAFVTVLIQSATFGTSISEALRVYAAEMRDKRVMRAEEKANTLPTKLTLGTMMFTLPPLLIILIGPSIYNIYLTLVVGQQ